MRVVAQRQGVIPPSSLVLFKLHLAAAGPTAFTRPQPQFVSVLINSGASFKHLLSELHRSPTLEFPAYTLPHLWNTFQHPAFDLALRNVVLLCSGLQWPPMALALRAVPPGSGQVPLQPAPLALLAGCLQPPHRLNCYCLWFSLTSISCPHQSHSYKRKKATGAATLPSHRHVPSPLRACYAAFA